MAQVIKFNFKIIIKFKKINPKIWIKPQIRNIETNYQINMINNQKNYKFNMINPYLYFRKQKFTKLKLAYFLNLFVS